MSLFGNGILGSHGVILGFGDSSGMANAAWQQQQQFSGQQAYLDQLLRYQQQQHQQYQQTTTQKPKSDDNIIDAEFTVMEIDGQKLLDSDKKS